MAASLVLALIVLHHSTHDVAHPSLIASWFGPVPAVRTHPIPDIDRRPIAPPQPTPIPTANPRHLARGPADPGPDLARPLVKARRVAEPRTAEDLVEARDRIKLAGMIGGTHPVVRALIATDDDRASDRVRTLLQAEARKVPDFGRITIEQGLVVDPSWPDGAVVYPVVLDGRGCRPFLDRLEAVFPGLKVESKVAAGLLTQLPEVGGIAFFRGVEAAPLGAPPRELRPLIATKNLQPGLRVSDPIVHDLTRPNPREVRPTSPPGLDRELLGPRDGDVAEPFGPILEDRGNVTVLVWVTHPAH